MAKKKPEVQEANEATVVLTRTERYFQENKKSLLIIFGAIVLVLGGYFGYRVFYKAPREIKSREMVWQPMQYFNVQVSQNEADSFKIARNGIEAKNGQPGFYGFEYIVNEFDGTMAGELAQYSLGIISLNEGKYEEAIEHFEGVDVEDIMISTLTIGLAGDAYSELGNYDEAIAKYEEALANNENELTSPLFMKKAALLYEEKGDFSKALEYYEKIRDNYELSAQGSEIDKYIARAKNK